MENQPHNTVPPVEVWGGVECTINRVGDRYIDQFDSSGHYLRLDDLDRFAEIGLRTLRYPILWERHLSSPYQPDWRFADERLARLRQLGIRPIVGLVHHGSGPRYTQLDDPGFAVGLAHYARLVAERFPWVEAYTPVNEPLTTARFSGLYGLWYPHHRSNAAFARMLINQCRATVLAMAEIRKVQPNAQLVQTEDLGQCHSTPLLAYQADFENERRWLTFDILSGHFNQTHRLWKQWCELGIAESELIFFLENPCPPDLIGINHYLTSERYLDERLERYPGYAYGGNHRHTYVDVEAIRVPEAEPVGPYHLLKQAWERYHRPIAVTEVHLGCTREEQLRWFSQVWNAANRLKSEGADVQAVTAWALLGSYDWDSLLTRERLHYEPGVFDLRAEQPRPTALAHLIRGIARRGKPAHPTLDEPGWWQRQTRWTIPHASEVGIMKVVKSISSRPILIVGANGTLGQAFARISAQRGLSHHLLNRQEMDITNSSQVQRVINQLNPWAVINAAGYERVAQAEHDSGQCFRENTHGATNLAQVCRQKRIRLLMFSSDLVFDGKKGGAYVENDLPAPQNIYGISKMAAEQGVLRCLPDALVIRSSAFFGPWDEYNFLTQFLNAMQTGQPFEADAHVKVSPTYVPDLVQASLDLLMDSESGIWHLANDGEVSWAEWGRLAALQAGFDPLVINGWYDEQIVGSLGKVPVSTALSSRKAHLMPSLSDALVRYANECEYLLPIAQVG